MTLVLRNVETLYKRVQWDLGNYPLQEVKKQTKLLVSIMYIEVAL